MKRTFCVLALLSLPATAGAVPIGAVPITLPCGRVCEWAEIVVPNPPAPPDPGWSPELTAADIAALKLIDDLHEPERVTLWTLVCTDQALPPGISRPPIALPPTTGQPRPPVEPPPTTDQPRPPSEPEPRTLTVAEPAITSLVLLGLVAGRRRWRQR